MYQLFPHELFTCLHSKHYVTVKHILHSRTRAARVFNKDKRLHLTELTYMLHRTALVSRTTSSTEHLHNTVPFTYFTAAARNSRLT